MSGSARLHRQAGVRTGDQEDRKQVRRPVGDDGAKLRHVRHEGRGGEAAAPDRVLQAPTEQIRPRSHFVLGAGAEVAEESARAGGSPWRGVYD